VTRLEPDKSSRLLTSSPTMAERSAGHALVPVGAEVTRLGSDKTAGLLTSSPTMAERSARHALVPVGAEVTRLGSDKTAGLLTSSPTMAERSAGHAPVPVGAEVTRLCFESKDRTMNEATSKRNGIGAPVSDPACFVGSAILHPPSSIFAFMRAGRRCRTASFYPMPARGLRCNRPAQTQNSDSGNIWSDLVTLSHFRSSFDQVLVKFWSNSASRVGMPRCEPWVRRSPTRRVPLTLIFTEGNKGNKTKNPLRLLRLLLWAQSFCSFSRQSRLSGLHPLGIIL
jgi:hypothetical protein